MSPCDPERLSPVHARRSRATVQVELECDGLGTTWRLSIVNGRITVAASSPAAPAPDLRLALDEEAWRRFWQTEAPAPPQRPDPPEIRLGRPEPSATPDVRWVAPPPWDLGDLTDQLTPGPIAHVDGRLGIGVSGTPWGTLRCDLQVADGRVTAVAPPDPDQTADVIVELSMVGLAGVRLGLVHPVEALGTGRLDGQVGHLRMLTGLFWSETFQSSWMTGPGDAWIPFSALCDAWADPEIEAWRSRIES